MNENESEKNRQMHIIDFQNTNRIRFGRGHETDVRIIDISVSRLHAIMHKDELGRIYIEDNESKFGTLVMVQAPIHLNEHFEYSFQAGRSVFHVCQQQEQSLFQFIKTQPPQPLPIFKDEQGHIIPVHPSGNGSEESNLEKLSRNYKIFRSYIG